MKHVKVAAPQSGGGDSAFDRLGTLYLVSTPIGNLEDISARALRVMREVSYICAEDTRVTRKLLAHFDIHTPMVSLHEHSGDTQLEKLGARLIKGECLALVTDAGTPGVSDPGGRMVRVAVRVGATVCPVPGPSAVISALIVSDLPTGRFCFEGFPPRTKTDRSEFFTALQGESRTIVLFEAPTRLASTLADLHRFLGNRRIAVCRELTKLHEEVFRGSISDAEEHFAGTTVRGELTLVLQGAGTGVMSHPSETSVELALKDRLRGGESSRDAVDWVTAKFGLPRRTVYRMLVKMNEENCTD